MKYLPTEVLEIILRDLPLHMRFKVAMSSKKLYEKVRHLPLDIKYNIDSNKGVESVVSFFFTSVIKVNVVIDDKPVNHASLKNMLASFYCLPLLFPQLP